MKIYEENFNCIKNLTTNSQILQCSTTLGYSKSFSIIYKVISIIGFLSNVIILMTKM